MGICAYLQLDVYLQNKVHGACLGGVLGGDVKALFYP